MPRKCINIIASAKLKNVCINDMEDAKKWLKVY
jgi:hypothetical protein